MRSVRPLLAVLALLAVRCRGFRPPVLDARAAQTAARATRSAVDLGLGAPAPETEERAPTNKDAPLAWKQGPAPMRVARPAAKDESKGPAVALPTIPSAEEVLPVVRERLDRGVAILTEGVESTKAATEKGLQAVRDGARAATLVDPAEDPADDAGLQVKDLGAFCEENPVCSLDIDRDGTISESDLLRVSVKAAAYNGISSAVDEPLVGAAIGLVVFTGSLFELSELTETFSPSIAGVALLGLGQAAYHMRVLIRELVELDEALTKKDEALADADEE